jgi:hypothetical protein
VVDQSLLQRAADRGVTICFADLDGADGLWVPEERTVLVNRGLPQAKVAEVIEHELGHVMIDDQHADLDAGKEVLVGQPSGRRRETAALAAALGLVAVVGGVMYGIHTARGPDKFERVAPNPNAPGLTAHETGPSPSLSPSRGPDGGIVYVTVYPTAATASGLGPPIMPSTIGPTATKRAPTRTSVVPTSGPPPPPPTISPSPAPPQTSDPPVQTSPPAPTTVPPTTPAETAGNVGDTGGAGDPGGVGDTGGAGNTDNAPVGGDPATAADASVMVPADSTTGS